MHPVQLELNFDAPELSGLERDVWELIRERTKEDPISVPELLSKLGFDQNDRASERAVRKAVERLVKEHGMPIGSSCGKKSGYYHITDPFELERNYRFLIKVAKAYLVRASRLKKSNLARLIGQLELELKKENGNSESSQGGAV